MTLPAPHPERRLKHRRTLEVEVHARPDHLWEVEALLTDVKTTDAPMSEGVRKAGTPIHQLRLRLLVNARLDVLQAGSRSEWTPYPAHCPEHGDAYAALEGLNLAGGFRRAVSERLSGVRGCTHLTELAQILPTAVIQGMVGETIDPRGTHDTTPPFQLDRCHALRTDGEAVRLHYPRWHRQPRAKLDTDNATPAPGVAGAE
ncbi:MAG: hypothetical protein RLZ83_620 [Pseudomonadota bacterium]|jgi:hypothetical protein